MKKPGALAAIALLAASLAPDGARGQEATTEKTTETEVIRSISDVTRYDSALGANSEDVGKTADPAAAKAPEAPKAEPRTATIDPDDPSESKIPEPEDDGKAWVTPTKAKTAKSPLTVTIKQPAAGETATKANGVAAAAPVVAVPAKPPVNEINLTIILPGEGTAKEDGANGAHPSLLDAVKKAAETSGGKVIVIQPRATAKPKPKLPVVVRGIPSDKAEAEPEEPVKAAAEPRPEPEVMRTTSGRNFWFYNREEGLLIGCRLVGTARVGDNKRIKCSRPRPAPEFH